MKNWDVWIEGFWVTGMEGVAADAQLLGRFPGETFLDACMAWQQNRPTAEDGYQVRAPDADHPHPTFWACRMFDNEADARKTFG